MFVMTLRFPSLLIGMTMLLWFVPSIGTQGMGTTGARVVHADAALFDIDSLHRAEALGLLVSADRAAEIAISR